MTKSDPRSCGGVSRDDFAEAITVALIPAHAGVFLKAAEELDVQRPDPRSCGGVSEIRRLENLPPV